MNAAHLAAALVLLCVSSAAVAESRRPLAPAETLYADFMDAAGASAAIESGAIATFDGLDRAAWKARYEQSLAALNAALARIDEQRLSTRDRRAFASMRSGVEWRTEASLAPTGDCNGAARMDASGDDLRVALYACFSSIGDAIPFEGRTYARVAALHSQQDSEAQRDAVARFLRGELELFYVSPERAALASFRRMLARTRIALHAPVLRGLCDEPRH